MSDEPESHELVMPFVSVASKGGPHDDDAYVCGYEMGVLDAYLEHARPQRYELTIHTANRDQADLIAMHRGYTATFRDSDFDGWTFGLLEVCTPGSAP